MSITVEAEKAQSSFSSHATRPLFTIWASRHICVAWLSFISTPTLSHITSVSFLLELSHAFTSAHTAQPAPNLTTGLVACSPTASSGAEKHGSHANTQDQMLRYLSSMDTQSLLCVSAWISITPAVGVGWGVLFACSPVSVTAESMLSSPSLLLTLSCIFTPFLPSFLCHLSPLHPLLFLLSPLLKAPSSDPRHERSAASPFGWLRSRNRAVRTFSLRTFHECTNKDFNTPKRVHVYVWHLWGSYTQKRRSSRHNLQLRSTVRGCGRSLLLLFLIQLAFVV